MAQPIFFKRPPSSTLAELAALTGAVLVDPARGGHVIRDIASLDEAGPMHLAFFDNLKYADQLKATKAGACLVSPRFEAQVPAHVAVLRAVQPFRAFVKLAREWHADALRPQSWFDNDGIAPSAIIDPSAHLEDGVIVDPLAVIGPRVEIGAGTVVGADHRDPVCADRQQRRSEEHTSELQSRVELVCRLLLEKKKTSLNGCCRRWHA